MSSSNSSGRPSGSVSIPVEIIRDSNSTNSTNNHSRHNSPYRTFQNDNSFGGFSNSPPWPSSSRFQPRHSPGPAYDRVISNSQFNQPFNDRPSFQTHQEPQFRHPSQQMYEPGPSHFSRSSEDLLNSPFDQMRYSNQPTYSSLIPPSFGSSLRNDSDFVQPTKFSSPLRRSFDALNDFGDMHQSFPTTRPYPSDYQQQQQPYYRTTYQTQYQPQQQQPSYTNQNPTNPNIVYTNEYGAPTDHYQANNNHGTGSNISNDRSRSPTSQRGPSPARNTPPTSQQQEEPELKMAKDAGGPIPMPPPASASSSPPNQSADQQVPSNESTSAPSPTPAEPVRDPDTTALSKLEKMKVDLDALEKEVDKFTGSTRHDRRYKGLDEQALKIMIRCDELVDVSADIKEKRKEMIRNVQRVINKLESKVPPTPAAENNSNPMETAATSTDKTNNSTDEEIIERKFSQSENAPSTQTTTTEQSVSS